MVQMRIPAILQAGGSLTLSEARKFKDNPSQMGPAADFEQLLKNLRSLTVLRIATKALPVGTTSITTAE